MQRKNQKCSKFEKREKQNYKKNSKKLNIYRNNLYNF